MGSAHNIFGREYTMNIRLKKTISDLKADAGRSILVVSALIIGLWGLGTILVSYRILSNDLNENYLQTTPVHAILTSKDFNRLDLKALRERPEVESAEFRDFAAVRIEVYPNEWIPCWVFGVDDFQQLRLARFFPQKGRHIPLPGTMLIERNGRLISNLDVGKSARIRSGSRNLTIPVTGIIYDPGQAPATQDHFIYAYVDKNTFADITGDPINQRLILKIRSAETKQDVQAGIDSLLNGLKPQEITVTTVKIPKFNEHPHQWQLNTLLFLIGSIGFLAFLMGAVLVSQLMGAILSRQVRQIGILKAVGASRAAIFLIYLTMLLAFGIVSGAIAIPLSIATGYAYSNFVADILNFEILTAHLPAEIYVYLIAASLLLPALLSLPVLLRGTGISVKAALGDYGIRNDKKTRTILASIKSPFNSYLNMAVRNSLRKTRRFVISVLSLALGVAIFTTGFNVRQSLWNLLTSVRHAQQYDVQVVLTEQIPQKKAARLFGSLDNLKKMELWNGGRGELQSRMIHTDAGIGIIALPLNSTIIHPEIVQGKWLQNNDLHGIVMNQQAQDLLNSPAVGQSMELSIKGQKTKVKLSGVIEEFDKPKIYMADTLYDSLANPERRFNSLMFISKNHSYNATIKMKKEIEKIIVSSDLKVMFVMSLAERVKVIFDHLNIILSSIIFLASMVLIVSAIGMSSATGITILERTREIGVMRAIGATPKTIYKLFITEGMVISTIGIALGVFLAWPFSLGASFFFGKLILGEGAVLKYAFSISGFVITLITTIVFSLTASRIPAGSAVKLATRKALAYE